MAKITKTVFSKRIRKEFLDTNIINKIQDILYIQNEAKFKAYSYLAYNKDIKIKIYKIKYYLPPY